MRLNIIIISLLSFILISCNHSKEVTVYKTEPIAINETKIEQTESYQLFKKTVIHAIVLQANRMMKLLHHQWQQ